MATSMGSRRGPQPRAAEADALKHDDDDDDDDEMDDGPGGRVWRHTALRLQPQAAI